MKKPALPAAIAASCLIPAFAFGPAFDGSVDSFLIQPDGKILVLGNFSVNGDKLIRLHPDGSLDASFDSNLTGTNLGAVALQDDGKILIGGASIQINGSLLQTALIRLNPDGSQDAAFTPDVDTVVSAILIQPDQRILLAGGITAINGAPRSGVVRLLADGTPDPTFTSTGDPGVFALALQRDGKVLVGGSFTSFGGSTRNRLARLNGDGSLDSTWNPNANSIVYALATLPDDRILVGGLFTTIRSTSRPYLARLENNNLDSSFAPVLGNRVYSLAPEVSGNLTVAGTFFTPAPRVARFDSAGSHLPALGAAANIEGSQLSAAVNLPDGRVLIGGLINAAGPDRTPYAALLPNDPAAGEIQTGCGGTTLHWHRRGSAPEVQHVRFDLSTDGGQNWSPLGEAGWVRDGWQLDGLSLPSGGPFMIRARGRQLMGGIWGVDGSLHEEAAELSVTPRLLHGLVLSSRPSAQGWTFDGDNTNTADIPESVYSASFGALKGNTIGRGTGATKSGRAHYSRSFPVGAFDGSRPLHVEWQARVLDDQQPGSVAFAFATGLSVRLAGKGVDLSFDRDEVLVDDGDADHPFGQFFAHPNGSDWVTFDLFLDPVASRHVVFMNGAKIKEGPTYSSGGASSTSFLVGDRSDGSNAQFEIRKLRFSQPDLPALAALGSLQLENHGSTLELDWHLAGPRLETSTSLGGDWTVVPHAGPPFSLPRNPNEPRRFWRLAEP